MDWKKEKLQSIWKLNKERLLFLFASGLLLFLIAIPNGPRKEETSGISGSGGTAAQTWSEGGALLSETDVQQNSESLLISGASSGSSAAAYEARLEERIRSLLSQVDGVGQVDVMVVLKTSGEQVYHTDTAISNSRSEEHTGTDADSAASSAPVTDKNGVIDVWAPISSSGRTTIAQDITENTVLDGATSMPILETERMPELSGVVITADGGGSARIKAEITEAMEALFNLPSHKVKVLKRTGSQ